MYVSSDIGLGRIPLERWPLTALEDSHGLPPRAQKAFSRLFGLQSVAVHPEPHAAMLADTLGDLVSTHPALRTKQGTVIYVRTQTHNTLAGDDWFAHVKVAAGLAHWSHLVFGMTHCAGGLAVLHMLREMAADGPTIVLSGEKAFHPVINTLGTAVMGEIPAAALVDSTGAWSGGGLRLTGSAVAHMPEFYANPHQMSVATKQAFGPAFAEGFEAFIDARFIAGAAPFDRVVFFNMNAPLLRKLCARFGWDEGLQTRHIAELGHGYCSDIFVNLADLARRDALRAGDRVLALAAGMGITFAGATFEFTPQQETDNAQ